jgi:hypothetical protein
MFVIQFSSGKPVVCVAVVSKAADEIRITILKSFEIKKENEFVVTRNKLTNNISGLVASGFCVEGFCSGERPAPNSSLRC